METEESGPIPKSIWDTRTKENSIFCSGCHVWITGDAFLWLRTLEERVAYHQKQYCKNHPNYNPTNV